MTKQETQIMKGVAILLMIFLHLFNQMSNVELCRSFIYIGDIPFVYWLSAAANPVAFFLILSGYGMHFIHVRGKGDIHRWNRIGKLYLHWGGILVLFTIPSFIYTGRYYVDFQQIISNYTAFNTPWYGEGWFLFPFICLSLLSPWIFKLTDRYKVRWILPISFLLGTCTSFIISRYGAQYLYKNHWLYNPFLILHLAPSFIFGAMLQRTGFIHKMQEKYNSRWLWLALILVVIIVCVTRTAAWGPLYAMAFIVLFLSAPRWQWVDKGLMLLGNHSMNMWLIHAWFCYYIFHDLTYSLGYPLLIYIALIVISLLCSYLVNAICSLPLFIIEKCQNKK